MLCQNVIVGTCKLVDKDTKCKSCLSDLLKI